MTQPAAIVLPSLGGPSGVVRHVAHTRLAYALHPRLTERSCLRYLTKRLVSYFFNKIRKWRVSGNLNAPTSLC